MATLRVLALPSGPRNQPARLALREPCGNAGMGVASSMRPSALASGFPRGETSSPLSTQDPVFPTPVAEPGCGMGLEWGRTGACHASGIMGVSPLLTPSASRDGFFCYVTCLIHGCHETSPRALREHTASSPTSGSLPARSWSMASPKTHSLMPLNEARSRGRHPTSLSRDFFQAPLGCLTSPMPA